MTVTSSMQGKDYGDAIERSIEQALVKAGIRVSGTAISLAPVATGRLKGSITYQTKRTGSRVSGGAQPNDGVSKPQDDDVCYVGTNVNYAQAIEYGSKPHFIGSPVKMRKIGWRYIGMHPGYTGQPFLRPAVDIERGNITKDMALAIQAKMKEENRKRLLRG